ncbi:MAG: polysaccharide biosynthesis protein [Clostridia bacterium]|nr:polysaccharide biosynthesis protein [Clostridia bacterium]
MQNLHESSTKKRIRQLCLILIDAVCVAVCAMLALWTRFEFTTDLDAAYRTFFENAFRLLPLTITTTVLIYVIFGLYDSLWEFAGEREAVHICGASACAAAVHVLMQYLLDCPLPRSFLLLHCVLLMLGTLALRFGYRFVRRIRVRVGKNARRTMLVGAGAAGAMILNELQHSGFSQNKVVCLIDDDPAKHGRTLKGVPIIGGCDTLLRTAEKWRVEEIILAIPSLRAERRREILELCQQTSCKLKTLPGIYQIVNGEVGLHQLREVQIEDLLMRDAVNLQSKTVRDYYSGKVVLVTGGGGSIGSEICRRIAKCAPKKLVVFDIYENNAYDIQQELISEYGQGLNLVVEIGSVRDRKRLEGLFSMHRPQVVFHAAAHKHVPLMERSSAEAIKNNVYGTYNTADMAEKYGVEKFILISTDKAVNPTNVMGASKRLCEMVIQCRTDSATSFAAVRFGNVLGSNGSVVPLFRRQIAAGGPVTITDKRIVRYFMTIPEAAQLVAEAGAMAKNGELFVLDMGKPVRIYDLAVNLIQQSGLKPGIDIQIEEIGLRPGEKLYEELLIKTEMLDKTENDLIFIERDSALTRDDVDRKLAILAKAIEATDGLSGTAHIHEAIKATVPTFHDPEELNAKAESMREMREVATV